MKIIILLKATYRFNALPSTTFPITFFTKIEKKILQFMWQYKGLWIAKATLSKNSNTGGITVLVSSYIQSHSRKNSIVLVQKQKCRSMKQNERPALKPTQLQLPDIQRDAKNTYWRKASIFNKQCRKAECPQGEKWN